MYEDAPNVLIVTIDSLRRDYCSLYGEEETTPNLAKLGSRSTVFENAISPSTWTMQVHASLFTGLYPQEHGLHDKGLHLGDHPTIAERLNQYGYDCRAFGRNGWLESGDILRGFKFHRTNLSINVREELGFGRFSGIDKQSSPLIKRARNAAEAVGRKLRRRVFRHTPIDRLTVAACLNFLHRDSESPFCYFVHLKGAHHIYRPSTPYHGTFGQHSLSDRIRNQYYQERLLRDRGQIYTGNYAFDNHQLSVMEDLYRGCVRQSDHFIGELLDGIERAGVANNTIIIVLSDHGEHLGDDGKFGHQLSIDDALIRVPLVVSDPTGILEPHRIKSIIQLNDLYPTILSIFGDTPPETRSVNIARRTREFAFVHYDAAESFIERLVAGGVDRAALPPTSQRAVWAGPDSQLVWYPEQNSFTGPSADNNYLRTALDDHMDDIRSVPTSTGERLDDETISNLRELGYL